MSRTELQEDNVQQLFALVGRDNAVRLMRELGGVSFYVSQKPQKVEKMLSDIIGEEPSRRFCGVFRGGMAHIPRGLKYVNVERDSRIRADYDTNEYTIFDLVVKYRLSHSRIEQILKRPDPD